MVPVTDGYLWMKLLRSESSFDALLRAVEDDRKSRYAGNEGARIPVYGPEGSLRGLPADEEIMAFFDVLPEAFPTWRDTITLESIEKILEFSPLSLLHRISPRPYLIITTAGRDVVHPAWTVAALFERALLSAWNLCLLRKSSYILNLGFRSQMSWPEISFSSTCNLHHKSPYVRCL